VDCLPDTIVAPATNISAPAALAVIRMSGPQSLFALQQISGKEKFIPKKVSVVVLYDIQSKESIDESVVTFFKGPHSYTGEDLVEISCHGGTQIVSRIISTLLTIKNVRYARQGEFTQRAFENGKCNLLKAEAIHEIISAKNPLQFTIAKNAYFGKYRDTFFQLREKILNLLVLLEAHIEFPEEEDVVATENIVKSTISDLINSFEISIQQFDTYVQLKKGITVAIFGKPNVGKSTLFNTILGLDRSLVHDSQGTTRDYISEQFEYNNLMYTLIDTAGIGEKALSEIESLGMQKAEEIIQGADKKIFVTTAQNDQFTKEEYRFVTTLKKEDMVVITKTDLFNPRIKQKTVEEIGIPCIVGNVTNSLDKHKIQKFVRDNLRIEIGLFNDTHFIQNERQKNIAKSILDEFKKLEQQLPLSFEVVEMLLREIMVLMSEYVGDISIESIYDSLFSKFCIGK